VLFGIVGELGAGKTLSLTFFGFKNWFFRKHKIFSNYHLYKIPYYYIQAVKQFDFARDGVVLADEMWRIADSRLSLKSRNRFVSDILGRSRKRHLHYIFTTQIVEQLDKRIRKVMDFTAYPMLNLDKTICKVSFFRTGFPKESNFMKVSYFKTPVIFECYNTDEEVDMITEDDEENDAVADPKPMFQESKDAQPIYFESWEEADKYAENWWKKRQELLKRIL
jgi:hypothetical protein